MTPPRTLSYARVSSLTQVEGYSLDSQRDRARDYAAFKGWPEPIHFSDGGLSGRITARPGLTALLATIRPGDVVLVKDVTRVGRGGAVQTLGIIEEINQRGGSVVFIDQNIDTSAPLGKLILTMMAGFAELELETTRERTHYGRVQAAKMGHWPAGNVPYGYRRDGKRLAEHPENAAHVRAAFRILAGRSLNDAVRELNAQGIPNNTERRGAGSWNVPRVHDLINNPAYIGQGELRIGGAVIPIPTPALVTEAEWDAARDRPSSAGGIPRPERYPLSGHLRCPHGGTYNGSTQPGRGAGGTDWVTYRLLSRTKARLGCTCSDIGARTAEAQARAALAALLRDPTDPLHARALSNPAAYVPDPHEAERVDLKRQLANLATLQVRGAIELEDYLRLRADLKAKETALTRTDAPPPDYDLAQMAQAALAVEHSTNQELSAWLDLLKAELIVRDRQVEILRVQALG